MLAPSILDLATGPCHGPLAPPRVQQPFLGAGVGARELWRKKRSHTNPDKLRRGLHGGGQAPRWRDAQDRVGQILDSQLNRVTASPPGPASAVAPSDKGHPALQITHL